MCLFTEIEGLVKSGRVTWEESLQKIREVKRDRLCSMEDNDIEEMINKRELSWEVLLRIIKEADGKNSYHKMKMLCEPINCQILVDENENDIDILPCGKLNQYQLLFKKELWNNLSENARKLIIMILEASPNDWRQGKQGKILYSKVGKTKYRITKKNIRNLIINILGVKPGKVNKLFNEIKIFCHEIDM